MANNKSKIFIIGGIIVLAIIIIIGIIGVIGVIGGICLLGSMNTAESSLEPTSTPYYTYPTSSVNIAQDTRQKDMMNAKSDYEAKLSISNIELNSLNSYIGNKKSFVDLNDTKAFLDGYKTRSDSYQSKCYDTITAGKVYMQYLDVGSVEYNRVQSNEVTMSNNIQSYSDGYDQLFSEYTKAKAMLDAGNAYVAKIYVVKSASNDFYDYYNSRGLFSTWKSEWVNELDTKAKTLESSCDEAIIAGRNYQTYLEPNSASYKQVSDIERNLTVISEGARKITSDSESTSQLGSDVSSLVQLLPLLGVL